MCNNIFAEYGSFLLVFFLEFGFKLFGIVPAKKSGVLIYLW
jgi:hypothetical protein